MSTPESKSPTRSRADYWYFRWPARVALLGFSSFFLLCFGLQSLAMFAEGPLLFVLATILASLTCIPYTMLLLWLDRNEQEPAYLIATAFLWGAIVATGISGIFNTIAGGVAYSMVGNEFLASQLTASFSAPFIEELTKGAAVAFIYLLFKDEFDNVLDGILYGALVGMGFAWFENIVYYVNIGMEDGTGAMIKLTWLRGFLNGIGSHAAYTGLTGLGFGLLRVMRSGFLRWLVVPFFWMMAMFVHFSWNTFAGLFTIPAQTEAAVYLVSLPVAVAVIEMPFAFLLFFIILFVWRHEHHIIRSYLEDEPKDVATPDDIDRLVPARRRTWRTFLTLFTGGPLKWWHTHRLNDGLIALAFVKWHHKQDAETTWSADEDADVQRIREQIRTRRGHMG